MEKCSICGKEKNQTVFRFQQCSAHLFCKGCFFIKNTIIRINCRDCSKVLNVKRQVKETKNCFYCSGPSITSTCNNSHNICSNCIQNKEIDIKCYECYLKFFTFCFCCQSFNQKHMPIPANPSKTMCLKCLTTKYRMDTQNQIRPDMNCCCLCKKNPITLKLCESHGFCIQCTKILQLIADTEFFNPLIECGRCKYQIKQIDLVNICSICGGTENELIPIFACVKNHKSCKRCFIGQINTSNLACRDCRIYFQLKKANNKDNCTICYYNSSNTPTKTCSKHYICNTCEQKKKNTPVSIFHELIECQDCSQSSHLGIKNKLMNPIKNGTCQICSNNKELGCSCPRHEICKDCFRFEINAVKEYIGSCTVCLEIIGMACKICFEKSKKNQPIKCSHFHIYCNKCIKNENFFTRENKCNECTEIFRKFKQEQKSRCAQCQKIVFSNSVCKDHYICDICLPTPDSTIIEKVYECSECINYSKFICQRCNEKSNYKESICLLDCQKLHLYCKTCFSDLQKASNSVCNCPRCKVLFQKDNYTKVKKFCSICNSIELAPMICDTHPFCSKCYVKTDKHVIESCKTCSNNLAKICIICVCLLTLLDKQNYISKEGFYLCNNCQPKKNISKVKNKPKNEKKNSSEQGSRNWILAEMVKFKSKPVSTFLTHDTIPDSYPPQFQQPNPQPFRENPIAINPSIYPQNHQISHLFNQFNDASNIPRGNPYFTATLPEKNLLVTNLSSGNPYFTGTLPENNLLVSNLPSGNPYFTATLPENNLLVSNIPQHSQNFNKKKLTVNCKKCNIEYPRLKCNHANCDKCLTKVFITKYQLFLADLRSKDPNVFKIQKYSISCPESDCKNKYCFPFDLFSEIAFNITVSYFSSTQNQTLKFLIHYEGFFEGVNYTFTTCNMCKDFVGKAAGQNCLCVSLAN